MRNSLIRLASLFVLSAILYSCGPTLSPFTQNLYEDNNWTDSELQRIQFYLSDDIVMYRELNGGSSQIIQGEIRMVNGRQVDQVTIRRGTPGVFLFSPKANRFAVSFEEGGNNRYLMFGPNPDVGQRYVLLGSNWDRRMGTVTYAGQKWQVDARSAYATLEVDLDRVNRSNVNRRVARGRRVN